MNRSTNIFGGKDIDEDVSTVSPGYMRASKRREAVITPPFMDYVFNWGDSLPGGGNAWESGAVKQQEGKDTVLNDVVSISALEAEVAVPANIGDNYTVTVMEGAAEFRGETGEPLFTEIEKGSIITVVGNTLIFQDKEAIVTGKISIENPNSYTMVKKSSDSVVLLFTQDNSEQEKIAYSMADKVSSNIAAIQEAGPIRIISPEDLMYVPGGKTTPGSREFEEAKLRENVSESISIAGYDSSADIGRVLYNVREDIEYVREKDAWREATEQEIRDGAGQRAVNVLQLTPEMYQAYVKYLEDENNPELWDKWNAVRFRMLPAGLDRQRGATERIGWRHTLETNGLSLLQAALSAEDVEKNTSLSEDIQGFVSRQKKDFSRDYLYCLLSANDVLAYSSKNAQVLEIQTILQARNFNEWLKFLRQLIMEMPIEPFDATAQLEQRRRVMWSV